MKRLQAYLKDFRLLKIDLKMLIVEIYDSCGRINFSERLIFCRPREGKPSEGVRTLVPMRQELISERLEYSVAANLHSTILQLLIILYFYDYYLNLLLLR